VEIMPEQVCNLSTLGEILQRLRIVSLPEQEMKYYAGAGLQPAPQRLRIVSLPEQEMKYYAGAGLQPAPQRLRIVSLPEQEMKSINSMKKDFVPAIVFIKKR
jgi:hypothetical protein